MAKMSKKKIEIFQVIFSKEDGVKLTFEDVLVSDSVKDFEAFINGKDVSVTILDTGATIVGVVETTRNDNVPPKKHRKKKKIDKIGLANEEGLAYANAFLYEKKRRILMYEVNKFGSYVNHFLKCVKECCSADERWDKKFDAVLNPLLNPDEYVRLQKMNYFKTLDLQLANPKAILKEYDKKRMGALGKTVEVLQELHSETFTGRFEVRSKRQGGRGLSDRTVREIVDDVRGLLTTKGGSENIKRLVVRGYAVDEEDNKEKLEPIDLLADRYLKEIKLNEPRENVDLLEAQRSKEMKNLYKKCLPDFITILGD